MSEHHSDLGPSVRRLRGAVVVETLARGTAGGETKRARVCDPLTAIAASGGLGNADERARRMLAAETLRDMTDAAMGIRGDRPERVDGTPAGLLEQERAFAAKLAIARVWLAVRAEDKPVLRWVVLRWESLAAYGECHRETAAKRLRRGLDTVSETT